MKYIYLLIIAISLSTAAFGQKPDNQKQGAKNAATEASADDIARSALAAHGGEKLRALKTLVIRGSLDLNVFNQATPATFATAISGDRYSFIINSPFQPLKQVFDGQQTYSSLQGVALPPVTSLGFPVMQRIGDNGFVVSALADEKKKRKGFRVTTPEGYYTDFFLDDKTNQIKGYESSYEFQGRLISTSVEIDKSLLVEGILVPEKYSQRFDLGQLTAYAAFKVKEILINSKLDDDVFAIPK
ncbi:MAG: hypothetical protein K1X36_11460 [Pyrinomonadaceae bacterium]|nr:hypothetical protein [Pyrinomonadaceae bacterium]